MARILHFSAGITKKIDYPWGPMLFRAAACTGALYHIELYLVCGDLPGLEAGVYHYAPHDSALRLLRQGDYRGVVTEASGTSPTVGRCPRHSRLHRRILAQRLQVPGQGIPPRLLGLRRHPGQRAGHVLRFGGSRPDSCRLCRLLRKPAVGPGPSAGSCRRPGVPWVRLCPAVGAIAPARPPVSPDGAHFRQGD